MGIFGLSFKEKKVWKSIAPGNKICVRLKDTPHDIYRSSVIEVTKNGLMLKEVAPGWTAEEVQELTEAPLIVADDLKEFELL